MSAQGTLAPPDLPAVPNQQRSAIVRLLRKLAESPEAGVIIACVVVFIVIAINSPTYASVGNLQVMGRDLAQVGILAVGEALVILTGGIDLSVGALAGLAGIFAAFFNVNEGLPGWLSIIITIVICAAIGFWHGTMVTKLKVPPFVITLVTFTVAQGLALAITSGLPINGIDPIFSDLSSFYIQEVPVPALFFAAAVAVAWFVMERTYVGRQIYAVGGNKEAARLAGIPVARRITSTGDRPAERSRPIGRPRLGTDRYCRRRRRRRLALRRRGPDHRRGRRRDLAGNHR
jgi:ribose transport system permease protein